MCADTKNSSTWNCTFAVSLSSIPKTISVTNLEGAFFSTAAVAPIAYNLYLAFVSHLPCVLFVLQWSSIVYMSASVQPSPLTDGRAFDTVGVWLLGSSYLSPWQRETQSQTQWATPLAVETTRKVARLCHQIQSNDLPSVSVSQYLCVYVLEKDWQSVCLDRTVCDSLCRTHSECVCAYMTPVSMSVCFLG